MFCGNISTLHGVNMIEVISYSIAYIMVFLVQVGAVVMCIYGLYKYFTWRNF